MIVCDSLMTLCDAVHFMGGIGLPEHRIWA